MFVYHRILSPNILRKLPSVLRTNVRQKSVWVLARDKVFGKYLLLTNTISSGVLMAVGDLIQQQIEHVNGNHHPDSYDWRRNKHMFYVGMFQGPLTHMFYKILDRKFPGTAMKTIAKKILLDQLIASPFCIVLFFFGMNYLNGENFQVSRNELHDKFLTVYAADCSIWIPSQFINFYWLSPKYRVMYINWVTMCYNVFLSFIKHVDEIEWCVFPPLQFCNFFFVPPQMRVLYLNMIMVCYDTFLSHMKHRGMHKPALQD